MIKSSKSISALFFLFLCFFISSRYIQQILFDQDLNVGYSNKFFYSKSCKPKKNSLIDFYKKNNIRALLVILDAYPNEIIYKDFTGNESELHNYLNKNSVEKIKVFTPIQKTLSSLPFLLGKIPPLDNCKYPFLRGNFRPRLLLNHEFIGSNEGVCKEAYNYNSRNAFIRFKNKIRIKLDYDYKNKVKKLFTDCSISNPKVIDKFIKDIEKNNILDKKYKINIAHEFLFHSKVYVSDADIDNLYFYDSKFLNGIRYLISQLKESNSIDELIIMNDHGPRFRDKYGRMDFLLKFNSGSLIDNNFYGVYAYRIPILKKDVNQKKSFELKELIPNSKERFYENSKGKIIKLENFVD